MAPKPKSLWNTSESTIWAGWVLITMFQFKPENWVSTFISMEGIILDRDHGGLSSKGGWFASCKCVLVLLLVMTCPLHLKILRLIRDTENGQYLSSKYPRTFFTIALAPKYIPEYNHTNCSLDCKFKANMKIHQSHATQLFHRGGYEYSIEGQFLSLFINFGCNKND